MNFSTDHSGSQGRSIYCYLPGSLRLCSYSGNTVCKQKPKTEEGTRFGVPISPSRLSSYVCPFFFCQKTQHNDVHTLPERLRETCSPQRPEGNSTHPLALRKALGRLTSVVLRGITSKIPLSSSVLLLAVMTTDKAQLMKRAKFQSCFSGRTQISSLIRNGVQERGGTGRRELENDFSYLSWLDRPSMEVTHEEGLACGGERISVSEFPVGRLDGTFQLQTSNVQVWGQAEKSYVKVKIWDPVAYRR